MANNAPIKSLSFDCRIHDENKNKNDDKDICKSFSFASRSHSDFDNSESGDPTKTSQTHDNNDNGVETEEPNMQGSDQEISLDRLSEDIDQLILSLSSSQPLEIPNSVGLFLKRLESMIEKYESSLEEDSIVFGHNAEDDSSFVAAVTRLSTLMDTLDGSKSNYTMSLLNEASSVVHHAMVFLEEELRYLLEESTCSNNSKHLDSSKNLKGRQPSFAVATHQDQQASLQEGGDFKNGEEGKEETSNGNAINFPSFTPESLSTIRLISNAMITCGYDVECCNVFLITRRHAFEEELKRQGFDKISVDDVQKMNWESLEGEIATWIRSFKHCSNHLFPGENNFYTSVLSDHPSIRHHLIADLSSAIFSLLVNFAEAVSMTKRSTEKLFKFLDMYETLRDLNLTMSMERSNEEEYVKELGSEFSFAGSRLGEAAVSIFCQLENSIKSDNSKTPVPSGAVHPLTRYTMNYMKYACEYKDTLEQVFKQHLRTEQSQSEEEIEQSPFALQLMTIMDLLDANLEAKSKLYKDLSLRYIFLMNNGRYMLQKVKGSTEIHQVVGDNWCRKRSSHVRHYHKSYQRETWSRVLQCMNQEGLQVNGKVHKPVLKERFKNFNQLFDEIHRSQSTWVVSDEQLQSELRVSISAVMIPAYRSFVARFGQIFTAGRQTEKYIKYQPEDIEGIIEELFDGNQNLSMPRRKT